MSLGSALGTGTGTSRAYIAHAAVAAVKATGRFGTDFAASDAAAYQAHSARLAAQRAAVYGGAPARSIAIKRRAVKA